MFNRIQLHLISKCSFTRQDTLPLQIRINHQNNGCIIVQVTNNRRHGFLTRKLRCPVPPVTRNDFITTVGVRTDNRRGEDSEISDTLRRFHHFLIINHTEGVSLERVQFRKRNFLHSLLLRFGSGLLGGENIIVPLQADVCAFSLHCLTPPSSKLGKHPLLFLSDRAERYCVLRH